MSDVLTEERDHVLIITVNRPEARNAINGGVAQGIAAALYEELAYSAQGQPLAGTFMDYLVPTASEIPRVAVHHLQTPCDLTETGAKGMGEGGTIGAPAAVLSALNDALRDHGADFRHIPVTPADLTRVLETALIREGT